MTDTEMERRKAICEVAGVKDIDDLSDGCHTFRQLYYQRMVLFATIVKQNKDKAWKSLRHEDGELCFGGGWFVVGIDTPEGSYTYHYEDNYFSLFDCVELERGKHWDGHTEKDVTRLLSLPSVQLEPCKSIEDILEYLNDVLFPIVSPGDWNVYSELFNMVSDLTSVQPEVLACGSGELNAQSEQRWIPIEKELPPVNKTVLLSHRSGVTIGWYNGMSYRTNTSARCIRTVKAWMPLPEQYRGEGD